MRDELAITGSISLLEQLTAFVPDDFVNGLVGLRRGPGRRSQWSAAQLYRLLLLTVLTPAHSSNLLLELMKEQRGWRKFADCKIASRCQSHRNCMTFVSYWASLV